LTQEKQITESTLIIGALAQDFRGIEYGSRLTFDQPGASMVLWGALRHSQLDPVKGIDGWHIGEADMKRIDEFLMETIRDPVETKMPMFHQS
jgi:hypothetical protein